MAMAIMKPSIIFILFSGLTLIRQYGHTKMLSAHKKEDLQFRQKHWTTLVFYGTYFAIWIPSWIFVFLGIPINYLLVVLGFFILLVGIIMRFVALNELSPRFYTNQIEIKENHQLVQSGIYAWARHPLYLALWIELFGMILISRQFYLLILWSTLLGVVIYRNRIEDSVLQRKFGIVFLTYKKKVPGMNIIFGAYRWWRQGKRGTPKTGTRVIVASDSNSEKVSLGSGPDPGRR
jgi:protein-S-isoprenylcysteine O-methyltransferase Ste14